MLAIISVILLLAMFYYRDKYLQQKERYDSLNNEYQKLLDRYYLTNNINFAEDAYEDRKKW